MKMKLLADRTQPPDIYHGWFTWMKFWEENFTPLNMINYGRRNVRKYRETKNNWQYITLYIYLKLDCLEKVKSTLPNQGIIWEDH